MRVKCTKEVFRWHIPKYGMYEVSAVKQQNSAIYNKIMQNILEMKKTTTYFKQINWPVFSWGLIM